MRTVNDLIKDLQQLVEQDAKIGSLPIVYASDEEGNEYQKVENNVALAQVEDIEDYFLELVGYYDEDSIIDYKDVNCVVIN